MPKQKNKIKSKDKKLSSPKLKKELDKVFSVYIRLRDSDDRGYAKCVTCDNVLNWKEIQAGHYISRRFLATRWEETNVHSQCRGCNLFADGAHDTYAIALMDLYGDDILRKLKAQKHKKFPWTRQLIESELHYYQEQVEFLKRIKNIF